MHPLAWPVLGCAAFASGFQLFQLLAARRFFRRAGAARRPGRFRPPVTVLKPLRGPGVELEANLESFCRQAYPRYQIVFGVAAADDPAVEVVRRIQGRFPQRDIALSVAQESGANRKVANLIHMLRAAKHDVLVLSDADVRVQPDYLGAMVGPLAHSDVGLTTALYRGAARAGAPSVIESLLIDADAIPMFVTAEWVQGLQNAYGASVAFKREALDAIGGFRGLADHLADDYLLGARIARAGWRLELLPYVVETVPDSTTLGEVWRHQLRWARTYRAQQPVGWFCSVVTHAMLWGVLAVGVTGGSPLGWTALATAVACRLAALRGIMRLLRAHGTPRWLWLVPLKDLAYSGLWLVSWLGRHVDWGGQLLRVGRDGRLAPGKGTAFARLRARSAPANAGADALSRPAVAP